MKLEKKETQIEGAFLVKFIECNDYVITYDKKIFFENGLNLNFIQENESKSKKNVLRGLDIQKKYPQGKLISVIYGEIYDVIVDMRKNSKTYLKWQGFKLSKENRQLLYIPEGCAHGFYVKSDFAKVLFKVSNYWHPEDEIGILWNDPTLNIDWNLEGQTPIISEKNKNYKTINLIKEFK